MGTFSYRAKDRKGAPIEGVMDAESPSAVTSRLQTMGYFPLSVQEVGRRRREISALGALRRPRVGDLASMYRQMSDLLGSGITLVRALTTVAEQTPNEQLRAILEQINADVSGGDSMAQAMAKHPKVFPRLQCSMVRAGEAGGMLPNVLERLADFAEQEEELRSKIWSAMAYPLVMMAAGAVAIVVLITVVIPRIIKIFEDIDQALPGITVFLIWVIDTVQAYWWAILGVIAVLVVGFWNLVRTDEGRLLVDRFLLRTPVLGTVILKREVAKFARTLGALIKNGVTILSALEIVIDVMSNQVIRREVEQIPLDVTQGEGISRTLQGSKIFPPVVVNMIAVGEETGHLDDALLRIADSYERQVDRSVKTLTSLIEPLIIVAMAVVVGFLVIAMLLPIFSIDVAGA
ncbi:type II secretion system F family protein [Candidatus Sumerlaeota bacterium]|nr:type II secretion system F family protein [Candidatus Sumerlaeota bacterium]